MKCYSLQEVPARDIIALSTRAPIRPADLFGQRTTLRASLAAGRRTSFQNLVSHPAILGSEDGFARYRLRLSSWLWLATQTRNSRVLQDKSVAVFADYAPYADWQWSDDAQALLNAIPPRSYCCQYRESDYDFVRRLLTEEGIAWRHQDGEDGQTLVLFADSSQQSATPEDASSAAGPGWKSALARVRTNELSLQEAIESMEQSIEIS
ncbi:contractile injection system protein, VgrG/Pvc8 family [Pseudoduganella sp.]|uniref:contractile injection system protein, VgrG/Pvc8 family n=1 Tax=Pseudoduganella sp. TaxID=1880898 RepID=UPI0035AE7C0E